MPEHMLMSEIEIITDGGRRRRWSASEKMRIVEETLEEGASISVVARRNGVAPNLLYRWRRLMLDGGAVAVSEDDDVTSNRAVRQMEERIRELERQLGRKTLAKSRNFFWFIYSIFTPFCTIFIILLHHSYSFCKTFLYFKSFTLEYMTIITCSQIISQWIFDY